MSGAHASPGVSCQKTLHHPTENSSRPHGFGRLDIETFIPFPKNPVMARFFRQIGRADELGSGMRKLMKYGKAYGGSDPELIEGDIFRMIIKVPEFDTKRDMPSTATGHVMDQVGTKSALSRHQVQILKICLEEQPISALMAIAQRSDRTKFRNQVLKPLLTAGWVEMTIPDKPTSSKQKYRLTNKGRNLLKDKP